MRNIKPELGCHTWARPSTAITSTNHYILVSRAWTGHWFTDTTMLKNSRVQARSFANEAVVTDGAVVRSKLGFVFTGLTCSDANEFFGAKQFRNVSAGATEEGAVMLLGSVHRGGTDQCHQYSSNHHHDRLRRMCKQMTVIFTSTIKWNKREEFDGDLCWLDDGGERWWWHKDDDGSAVIEIWT